jgi:hypothetical protein
MSVTKALHELLAVESNLAGQADACRADLTNTFDKKRHLFERKITEFRPIAEGAAPEIEAQSDIQTSIASELGWIQEKIAASWDVSYQVAEGNMAARADVVLDDGTVLLKDVPATHLLQLEKRVQEVAELLTKVPTLDPAKGFTRDDAAGKHIYKAREERKRRTVKVQKPLVLYPATPEHPAQTQMVSVDEPTGTVASQEWSSLITPSEKGDLLDRVERLRRAVKSARARANRVEVDVTRKIGDVLLGYVFAGSRQ